MIVPGRPSCGRVRGLGNWAWDILGVNFWSRDFLGVLIFDPIRSSPSLEIRSTPLGLRYVLMDLLRGLNSNRCLRSSRSPGK